MRALTNDYKDCKLIRLDEREAHSPFIVTQVGYLSSDPTCRMRLFYLQRDGLWIDEIARSTRPDSELKDVIFESTGEALQVLSRLLGPPVVRELPITEADAQAYLARVKGGTGEDLLRSALARYRATK
jgi:hypothetical protein